MKTEIRTDGLTGWKRRALAEARKLDRGEKLKPNRSITFESPDEMLQMMTPGRRRVVETVRHQPMTVHALAKRLKRDPAAVSRDVTAMERAGLLYCRQVKNPGHGLVKEISASAQHFTLTASF